MSGGTVRLLRHFGRSKVPPPAQLPSGHQCLQTLHSVPARRRIIPVVDVDCSIFYRPADLDAGISGNGLPRPSSRSTVRFSAWQEWNDGLSPEQFARLCLISRTDCVAENTTLDDSRLLLKSAAPGIGGSLRGICQSASSAPIDRLSCDSILVPRALRSVTPCLEDTGYTWNGPKYPCSQPRQARRCAVAKTHSQSNFDIWSVIRSYCSIILRCRCALGCRGYCGVGCAVGRRRRADVGDAPRRIERVVRAG